MIPGKEKLVEITDRILGRTIFTDLKPLETILTEINRREAALGSKTDSALVAAFNELRSDPLFWRAESSAEMPVSLLAECFAIVREAAWRKLGLRMFDVQILAGIALHQGNVVQMNTGEGKTLTAVLPACLNALYGQGIHIMTHNDYLAGRDAAWMGSVYDFLGLSVGVIQENMTMESRREAYDSDITYGTAKEIGFDLLRSNLAYEVEELIQRPFQMAIVDEADSILIDEARTPLVIAGQIDDNEPESFRLWEIIQRLDPGEDYEINNQGRNACLTEQGLTKIEKWLGRDDLFEHEFRDQMTQLYFALQAEVLLERDVDYIVRGGRVEQIDEFTGRVAKDRLWPNGLQAAVEEKEHVQTRPEGTILASVTISNYLSLYPKLAGMTATATEAAEELWRQFDLPVMVIPPNKPNIRIDLPDFLFTDQEAKEEALIDEISEHSQTGRPILVGTGSILESEQISKRLRDSGIECQVLNAKTDAQEAEIIAEAGALGAVTISTNMAGRGTDIRLGGTTGANRELIVELGGLYVIGTQRYESRRIDNQLRGRAGRQGDPGQSRFFLSLEDDLFDNRDLTGLLAETRLRKRQSEPIAGAGLVEEISHWQRIVEGENFEIRWMLYKYSAILERQRQLISSKRAEALLARAESELMALLPDLQGRETFRSLAGTFGREAADRALRKICLFHIDRCWAEHLAELGAIKEGIHLARAAGRDPLDEFHDLSLKSFTHMQYEMERRVRESLRGLQGRSLNLEEIGIKSPSATWTYLINDQLTDDRFDALTAEGNIGLSVGAAILAPLFICQAAYRKLKSW